MLFRSRIEGLGGADARIRVLDEASAVGALRDPARFRADAGASVPIEDGALLLALPPYAIARVVARA